MKKTALLAAIVLTPVFASGQEIDPHIWIQVKTGYTSFQLSDVRDLMGNGIAWYNSMGIPVKLQTDFPGNALLGGDAYYRSGSVRVGVGLYTTNTMGFFGAQDVSGELKVKSMVRLFLIQGILGLESRPRGGGRWHVALKPGYAFGVWDLSERVSYVEFTAANIDNSVSGHIDGFTVEAVAGLDMNFFSPFVIGWDVGYRKTGNPRRYFSQLEHEIALNTSGFIATVFLGIGL